MRCGGKRKPNCVKWLEVFRRELWEEREENGAQHRQRVERWCQEINELLQEVQAPRPFSSGDIKLVVSPTICQSGNDNIRLLRRRCANVNFTGNFFTGGVNK